MGHVALNFPCIIMRYASLPFPTVSSCHLVLGSMYTDPVSIIVDPHSQKSHDIFLAGVGHTLDGKLEFKHRLSIALEAAKGDPLQNQ